MKIYTKRGDKGYTDLYMGRRVPKNDPLLELIGTLDELSSFLGVAVSYAELDVKKALIKVQKDLFAIGAFYSGSDIEFNTSSYTSRLERTIDKFNADIPQLKNFILPGGSTYASFLHLARAVCRRAERNATRLSYSDEVFFKKHQKVICYLNRLSDLLFVLARYANFRSTVQEIEWSKKDV